MSFALIPGKLKHTRLEPVFHEFEYDVFYFKINLLQWEDLEKELSFFSWNRWNIFSIRFEDYISHLKKPIFDKLKKLVESFPNSKKFDSAELITMPRYFNYAFNPVNFYYLYENSKLNAVLAEVYNTFGEKHFYYLDRQSNQSSIYTIVESQSKEFHVSPFNDREGQYDFYFGALEEALDIRINLKKEGQKVFLSHLKGPFTKLNQKNLFTVLMKMPFVLFKTTFRILWQAAKLYYSKKLPIIKKPVLLNQRSLVYQKMTLLEKITSQAVLRFFGKFREGLLHFVLPNRSEIFFGDHQSQLRVKLIVHDNAFFKRCFFEGDLGFAESYLKKEWECDDLKNLFKIILINQNYADDAKRLSSIVYRLFNTIQHRKQRNSIRGSRKNIKAHYDLSNDFFKLILDKHMLYSSAIFKSTQESLEQAQIRKVDHLLSKLNLELDCHLLEIGSGWGGAALRAAELYGCRVTSITLSKEQLSYAREESKRRGLDHLVDFVLKDYRKLDQKYDRILSIEMLEAVGHQYLGDYFAKVDQVLNKGGLAVFQVITMPDYKYDSYRKRCDFIQKYIFPGAQLPSLGSLQEALKKRTHLFIDHIENIASDYVLTLLEWKKNLNEKRDEILSLGFDERFLRLWNYYFSYCAAGFEGQAIQNLQILLRREGEVLEKRLKDDDQPRIKYTS